MDPAQLQAAFLRTARRVTVAGASIDLADLQGDILRAYGNAYAHTAYLFFRVDDAGAGRAWLRGLLAARDDRRAVARRQAADDAQPRGDRRRAAGRSACPTPVLATLLARVPRRHGRAGRRRWATPARATRTSWEPELHGAGAARAGHGQRARRRRAASASSRACAATPRAPAASPWPTSSAPQLLPGSREHFGYADGFAQPALAGVDDASDRRIGGGVPEAKGAWRALAPGEFILGYEDEDTRVDPAAHAAERAGRPVRALGHLHGVAQALPGRRALPPRAARGRRALRRRRPREARGQGRRALAQRHAAGHSPRTRRSRTSTPRRPSANDFRYAAADPRRPALPARRAHPPHQPARRARLRRAAQLPPSHHPARDALRPAAGRRGDRGRPRRPRPGLRLLQREHLAPVRGHPGAVAQRRQRLPPRPRQRLPHGRPATGRAR